VTPTPANADSAAPPADYRLLLPEGWFRMRIEPDARERSVDALLDRQFAGVDNAPHIKRQLREELLAQAAAAVEGGGLELYLSLQQAGPLTIPASLLITLLPAPPGGALPGMADLAKDLAAEADAEVSVRELSAGRALRVRRSTGQSDRRPPAGIRGNTDQVLPSVTLDYQLSIPGTGAHLLLTFSTPLVQIAEAMTELFDAVAGSLTWLSGDGCHE
jgi:hypothetical protein